MVRKFSERDIRLCVMKSVVKFDVGEETSRLVCQTILSVDGCDPKDITCSDATGLFFSPLPSKTPCWKG